MINNMFNFSFYCGSLLNALTGNKFSYSESISQFAASSTIPIYGVWDFSLEEELALTVQPKVNKKILTGITPKFPANYKYLGKYNIDQTLLPSGSIILNRPISIFEKYSTFYLAEGLLLIILMISIIQRKKAKDQLKIFKAPDSLTGVLNREQAWLFYNSKLMITSERITS